MTIVGCCLAIGGNQLLRGDEPGQLKWVRRGAPKEPATVQQNLSLAQPMRAADAREPANSSASVTVLRWRTSDVAQTQPARGERPEPAHFVTVSQSRPNVYPVRPASATQEDLPAAIPDSFADPFGDGTSASKAREPIAPQPPAEFREQVPAPPTTPERMPQSAPESTWDDDDLPPVPRGPLQSPPQPLPLPPGNALQEPSTDQRKQQCGTYNRRDCCKAGEACSDARHHWQTDAIAKIDMDITPNMHPDQLDPREQEEMRNEDLAESPVRKWRDREDNILAEGRLNNVKYGNVLVLDANNQIVRVPWDKLSDDDLCFVTAWWRVPAECTFGDQQFAQRNFTPSTLTWKASALCHKPLYFEQVQLERYGHTAGPILQPVLSGAHFFGSVITLPYQAGINPPWECQYALGYYRPGSCAPWLVPPVPLSVRGGLWQAGAVVGGVFLFP